MVGYTLPISYAPYSVEPAAWTARFAIRISAPGYEEQPSPRIEDGGKSGG